MHHCWEAKGINIIEINDIHINHVDISRHLFQVHINPKSTSISMEREMATHKALKKKLCRCQDTAFRSTFLQVACRTNWDARLQTQHSQAKKNGQFTANVTNKGRGNVGSSAANCRSRLFSAAGNRLFYEEVEGVLVFSHRQWQYNNNANITRRFGQQSAFVSGEKKYSFT